jgi:hypothetical protein
MKNILSIIIVFVTVIPGFGQDLIIKSDKSEITAKVLEIEETSIKYKQFNFLDGPTYNIKKTDVFMIIYQNGQRETFETTKSTSAGSNIQINTPAHTSQPEQSSLNTGASVIKIEGSTEVLDKENVNYSPFKLLFYTGGISGSSYGSDYGASAFLLESTFETPLLKNYINYGISGFYTSITGSTSGDYGGATGDASGYGLGGYLSGFISINRITGSIDKQNKGFFPFVRTGYFYSTMTYNASSSVDGGEYNYSTGDIEVSGYGFDYRVGLDYLFSKKFGVTMATNFSSFGGGINFQF